MIPPHPLTIFGIQAYDQNEPRFNGAFSKDNLPNKIKNGAYVMNLDEYHDISTHWVSHWYKVMCGYFCIGFINFMFNGNSLIDFTNLFSPNN